jgi:hypothetical protein
MTTFFKSENIKLFNQTSVVSESTLLSAIASSTETNSIVSGQQSDLNYINVAGDTMDGALKLASYIEFNDNTQQSTAFSAAKDNILNYAYNNIQGISVNNGTTIITNPLSIQNTIAVPDNSLPISKIINLQDQLQNLDNKDTSINIILSQQLGYGCFDSLKLCPYDNIHCYLNIPDTSGRDSLFQAEARRCKEIIDSIDTLDSNKHFCIFDELYSGTNPDEAIKSATAFMNYIVKHDNVTCLLTTHYVKLCKKLAKNKKIKNYNMKSQKKNENFEYTYLLEEGISKIKGGLKVLKDMDYPQEILDNTK